MNLKDITHHIMWGNLTNDELRAISTAVTFRRGQITRQTRASLRVGDTVKFDNTKRGVIMRGTLEKVAVKWATVRVAGSLWRVPLSMLTAA